MDRRDALKKIGIGGAAVVGASVIVSQPAFAFADPNSIVNPSFTFASFPNDGRVRYIVNAGSAACTASSTGPIGVVTVTGSFTTTTPLANGLVRLGGSGSSGSFVLSGTPGTLIDGGNLAFDKLPYDPATNPYVDGDVISYTLTTTWTCTYDNASPNPPTLTTATGVTSGTISFPGGLPTLTP